MSSLRCDQFGVRLAGTFGFLLALGACVDSPTETAGGATAPALSSHPTEGGGWTQDDEWAAMADRLPGGFGGYFIEGGELIVLARDPSRGPALLAALQQERAASDVRSRPARVRPAHHDFRQLKNWFDAFLREADGNAFVHLDIDEVNNRIEIGVEAAAYRNSVAAAARVAGIPERALRIVVVGSIAPSQSLVDSVRPVIGGLQILPTGCTLGFNVEHYEFGRAFATASHCTTWMGQVYGDNADQGGAGLSIGYEVFDEPVFTGTANGCPTGRVCRRADVALFKYHDAISVGQGEIARTTGFGSKVLDPQGPFLIWQAVDNWCIWQPCTFYTVGDIMQMVGASSGWRIGTVTSTCVLISFPNWVMPGNVSLPCQVGANYLSQSGDSGAPVMRWDDGWGSMTLAGMHNSRNTTTGISYFSGLPAIRQDLKPGIVWNGCAVRLTHPGSFWC